MRELCEFVAEYNNEAMRRQSPLIRQEDLARIIPWLRQDRRGVIPALLLAFGAAPRRRESSLDAAASVPPEDRDVTSGE